MCNEGNGAVEIPFKSRIAVEKCLAQKTTDNKLIDDDNTAVYNEAGDLIDFAGHA